MLFERYVDIGFSRVQGYQGYRRGILRYVAQGYKAIKAKGGGCMDGVLRHTRVSRPHSLERHIPVSPSSSLDSLVALRYLSLCPHPVALIPL